MNILARRFDGNGKRMDNCNLFKRRRDKEKQCVTNNFNDSLALAFIAIVLHIWRTVSLHNQYAPEVGF